MNNDFRILYTQFTDTAQRAADLNFASAVLGWDQEVYMPAKGADARGRQLATLTTEAHKILTSEDYGRLLAALVTAAATSEATEDMLANIRLSTLDYEKNKKLPAAFIEELSLLTSQGFNAWVDARGKNDFSVFAPHLEKMVALKRRQAALYGYTTHPYDALLNEYERGANIAMLEPVFELIRKELPLILKKIKGSEQVSDACFKTNFPKENQWDFSIKVLQQMGFDFEAGRQDYSEHPFTTSFSSSDVRITTRVDEHNFASLLWSSIHEGGHGLYEQGLPESQYGLPLGEAASLGIHESQSRLWENCIGRSKEFWHYFYPILQQHFPDSLGNLPEHEFYKACNRIAPSLIRTEADEVTYHFHVLIRYELEKALIEGSLEVKDLRNAWNAAYTKYLGIAPPDDKTGVLQDVHWSHGMFGYFPTYTLGSFYAVQFFEKAKAEIEAFDEHTKSGTFAPLLDWLRTNIHRHGRKYTSEELCTRVTGGGLDPQLFLNYVNRKYGAIYPGQ